LTRYLHHVLGLYFVFLASAQARQISGQTLLVDGGATGSVM
jgi:NAD(P)-dependent dehydrogenase (short-subunit alcohol dehydrogenase family)